MKLLIITQKVDRNDSILGFFHHWLEEFSKHFEKITVICLWRGEYHLPNNVNVLSLGKEGGTSKLKYLYRFYKYIWNERKNYDSVFVHMNQEYILMGAMFWKILGKKITMWRNHSSGNFLTRLAIYFSDKVFCTSSKSFSAKFDKTEIMPVGIDTNFFKPDDSISRKQNTILCLGRIAPIKKQDLFIESLGLLNQKEDEFMASIYGDPLPKDENYYLSLKKKAQVLEIENKVIFFQSVPNHTTPSIYASHNIFVNLSPDGLYDKTMFEAMSAGTLIVSPHSNLRGKINPELILDRVDAEDLAITLHNLLHLDSEKTNLIRNELRDYVEKNHDLAILANRLKIAIGNL